MERPVRARRHLRVALTVARHLALIIFSGLAAFASFSQLGTLVNISRGREHGQLTIWHGNPFYSSMGTFVTKTNRTAICLMGELRDFELTGPTIKKYLLAAYKNVDVFVNAPLNDKTHKLTLLLGSANFSKIYVSPERPIQHRNASQALLQYFDTVEGCLRLIQSHERELGFEYTYVLRTQLDGFWTGPPPPLPRNLDTYTVPLGSAFNGINDRLGVGGRKVSQLALSRMTALSELRQRGVAILNSETAFASQLQGKMVRIIRLGFPFCIMSRRRYKWPPDAFGVPILSISSVAHMNGAKCRPCRPTASGPSAEHLLRELDRRWGWPGANAGLNLCNSSHAWEPNAEFLFNATVGPAMAEESKQVMVRSMEECVSSFKRLEVETNYEGPSAAVVCQLAEWGSVGMLGNVQRGRGWPLYLQPLTAQSVVYSFGIQPDLSWERALVKSVGCKVHVFDGTPMAREWVRATKTSLEPEILIHEWNIGAENRLTVFHPISSANGTVQTYTTLNIPSEGPNPNSDAKELSLPTSRLKTIMEELKHDSGAVDVLKLDVDGTEFSLVLEDWSKMSEKLPVCQLLIRFATHLLGLPAGEALQFKALEALKRMGFVIIHCSGFFDSERCLLFREDLCR